MPVQLPLSAVFGARAVTQFVGSLGQTHACARLFDLFRCFCLNQAVARLLPEHRVRQLVKSATASATSACSRARSTLSVASAPVHAGSPPCTNWRCHCTRPLSLGWISHLRSSAHPSGIVPPPPVPVQAKSYHCTGTVSTDGVNQSQPARPGQQGQTTMRDNTGHKVTAYLHGFGDESETGNRQSNEQPAASGRYADLIPIRSADSVVHWPWINHA